MVHGRSHVETLHQKALRVFSATCCNETQRRSVLCGEWMVDYLVGGSNCFKVCFLRIPLVGPTSTTNNRFADSKAERLRVDQCLVKSIRPTQP